MKRFFFLLLAAVLLGSMSMSAQQNKSQAPKKAESETPLIGDVNGDGVVDVADIVAIITIMKNGGGTGEEAKYYWFFGYDEDDILYNDAKDDGIISLANKSKMMPLPSDNPPTNYTRASGNKYEIPGETPNYLLMIVPTTWPEIVIGNPAGGTIGLGLECTNVTINGIPGVKFNVYSSPGPGNIKFVYLN